MTQITLPEPLTITRTLNAPIASVWKALSDITVLRKWMPFIPDFKAEVGFETRFMLGRTEDRQYEHICQVTEAEPEKRLTYSWRYEGIPGDAYVTFELTPQDEQTLLTLTYRITELFPADNPDFDIKLAATGWNHLLGSLTELLEHSA